MYDETIKLIEELERVRLELFRSTASLDYCIEDIRFMLNSSENPNFIKQYIKGRLELRNNVVQVSGWDRLNEKEKEIIQKLNDSI